MQCGGDTLPEDPLGGFNVTPYGIGECLKSIMNVKLPLLILGGGKKKFCFFLIFVFITKNLKLNLYITICT